MPSTFPLSHLHNRNVLFERQGGTGLPAGCGGAHPGVPGRGPRGAPLSSGPHPRAGRHPAGMLALLSLLICLDSSSRARRLLARLPGDGVTPGCGRGCLKKSTVS